MKCTQPLKLKTLDQRDESCGECVYHLQEGIQGCHSYLRSQITDISDTILTRWTKNSWHFQRRLERERTNFSKHKTNTKQNIYFQEKEKETGTCVSDLTEGLTYMNRFLLSMFLSFPIFWLYNQSRLQSISVTINCFNQSK